MSLLVKKLIIPGSDTSKGLISLTCLHFLRNFDTVSNEKYQHDDKQLLACLCLKVVAISHVIFEEGMTVLHVLLFASESNIVLTLLFVLSIANIYCSKLYCSLCR